VHVVYSGTFISLFLTTVLQLLLFAKHWVGVIATSHRPIYWQTAATHNKFPKNFSLILNFQKIYNPIGKSLLFLGPLCTYFEKLNFHL